MDMNDPSSSSMTTMNMSAEEENVPKTLLSREGVEGDLPGHLLPSIFYFGFAMYMLIVSVNRARKSLPVNSKNKSFAELYVPESDPAVLRRVAGIVLITCSVGVVQQFLVSIYNGFHYYSRFMPLMYLGHEVVYFSFWVTGLAAWLESRHKLPPDSWRMCLAVAFLANYIMMDEHATMKPSIAEAKFHFLWAKINLAEAACLAYSVKFPQSTTAFIMGWALMILLAAWLLTTGLYSCCWDVKVHLIGTFLGLEIMVVTLGVVLVTGCYCPNFEDSVDNRSGSEYSPLKQHGGCHGDQEELGFCGNGDGN